MTFIKQLERMEACSEGMDWLKAAGYRTATEAWKNCPRADWMIWFAGKKGVDRKTLVTMACICARTALKYVPKGENRPRIAIETTEKWLRGEASLRDVEIAAPAAPAAYAAYAAHAAYAAYAAHAAHAAHAAATAATAHVATAATAHVAPAAYAAYAAAATAATAAATAAYAAYATATATAAAAACAKTKALKIMAEKIRKIYPAPPKRKGVK